MNAKDEKIEKIIENIRPLLARYPINKAILFGSYAQGKATKNSDIDIYIDSEGRLKGLDFVGLLDILVEALGVDVDLIDKSHIEPDSLMINEIQSKGVVIYEKSDNH